jgi:hypothetical protein
MVQDMSDNNEKPLDPEAARIVARVRRLMMIASMTTFVAVAVVLGVIGYRFFRTEGRVQPAMDASAPWPNGARVISSAMNDEQLALTIETPTGVEVRFYDLRTYKPLGRLPLGGKP